MEYIAAANRLYEISEPGADFDEHSTRARHPICRQTAAHWIRWVVRCLWRRRRKQHVHGHVRRYGSDWQGFGVVAQTIHQDAAAYRAVGQVLRVSVVRDSLYWRTSANAGTGEKLMRAKLDPASVLAETFEFGSVNYAGNNGLMDMDSIWRGRRAGSNK